MTFQGVKRKVVTVSDFRFTGRLLGKGNFARVEEAVHNIINVKVAVKIIDTRELKEKYIIKNLHREARVMSQLNHPCIATLFQTMQSTDNIYYLVTELISGGDLCSFIVKQRYGKLEEREARIFARQFVSALAHMHSFGIVHRDLKMENVMLNQRQTQIKIVDFGLSNIWNSENPLRTHCGSPEYAAPELFVAGKEYGPEVDIWSLGIILYGMVVGQLPFVASGNNQLSLHDRRKRLADQLIKGLVVKQRQALAPLSLEFRSMIAKLLVPQPFKRINIQELLKHPWLTERGKKYILTDPYPKINKTTQTKFIRQLSKVFQVDQDTILREITEKPFGRYGGILNILHYAQVSERYNSNRLEALVTSSNTANQKSASMVKSQQTLYNQWMVILNKASKKEENQTLSQTKVSTQNFTIINRKTQENLSSSNNLKTYRNSLPLTKVFGAEKSKIVDSKNKRPNTTDQRTCTGSSKPIKRNNKSAVTKLDSVKPKTSSNAVTVGDGIRSAPYNIGYQKLKLKDPLVNDPIARSIAGYLVKNVPEHMFNISNRLH